MRASAAQAHARIDGAADAIAQRNGAPAPAAPVPPVDQPSPMHFAEPGPPAAAVSFDLDDDLPQIEGLADDLASDLPFEASVDSEGIPFPEENF